MLYPFIIILLYFLILLLLTMTILFIIDFIVDSNPDVLLVLRCFGYEIIITLILLLQFIPKIISIFTNESSLDFSSNLTNLNNDSKMTKVSNPTIIPSIRTRSVISNQ